MTITEFINLHIAGVVNFGTRVNVLYNEVGGSSQGEIDAITVTVNALSFNDSQSPSDTDITNILEQVEEITFTFDGVTYILTIVERAFYSLNPSFFYFKVESNQPIPNIFDNDITSTTPVPDVVISFHPFLNDITFGTSDFNVILNNGSNLRLSSDKVQSDRREGLVIPTNFQAILDLSASKAEVQDSFYSSTGITNARYQGSKSTSEDQGGIKPSLSARAFNGTIFPFNANQDIVCGLVPGATERVIIEMLHTGNTQLPQFTTSSAGIVSDGTISPTDESFNYTTDLRLRPQVDVGDLIIPRGSSEIMKVKEHNVFTQRLVVTRKYNSGSIPGLGSSQTIADDTFFDKVNKSDIIKLEDFSNNILAANNAQVFVSDNNSIAFTDDFGTIISSSGCPDPLLLAIDDGATG